MLPCQRKFGNIGGQIPPDIVSYVRHVYKDRAESAAPYRNGRVAALQRAFDTTIAERTHTNHQPQSAAQQQTAPDYGELDWMNVVRSFIHQNPVC